MTLSLSVAVFCDERRRDMLKRLIRSVRPMEPDEIVVLNTGNPSFTEELLELGATVAAEKRFDNYRDSANAVLDLCSGDWILRLDSDEIASVEMAVEIRGFLQSVPDHVLSIRPKIIDMLEERYCLQHNHFMGRRSIHFHGRLFRQGYVRYEGPKNHEVAEYEGRTTLPLDHPEHPLLDWNRYFIHLWLYKDFPFLRWPGDINKYRDKIGIVPWEDIWHENQMRIIDRRDWTRTPMARGVSWDMEPWVFMTEEEALGQTGIDTYFRDEQ